VKVGIALIRRMRNSAEGLFMNAEGRAEARAKDAAIRISFYSPE